ncbi:TRC8 N-terminal domain family protein [Acanthocheilonema viteae]
MDVGEAVELFSVRVRTAFLRCMEIALRLPGLLLFELWWRSRDIHFNPDLFKQSFSSYLEMDQIIEFIQTRNLDQTGAQILSYAVVLMSLMFFLLPLYKLIQVYFHIFSLLLFSVAHYLSARYVQLEQNEDPNLKLDDFTKLERHGFHILAQLVLCVVQSCLLSLENDIARVTLAVFLIPIIARMCAVPIDRLIIAHNVACSLAIMAICIYVLNKTPALLISIRHSMRYLKALVIPRGIGAGAAILWHRLRIAEILISAWLTMFFTRVYVHLAGKGRGFDEIGAIFLASVAESTNTPLSLLALTLTVSCSCKQILTIAEYIVGGQQGHTHILANGGYTGALILALLCAQTGVLGMRTEQKAFLLGLVFLIVVSTLLQSLCEILELQLLEIAANRWTSRGQHMRSVFLSIIVIMTSLCTSAAVTRFLPIDLWCLIIVSNCLLTAVRTLSALIVYAIYVLERESMDTWGRADYVVFICKMITCGVEVLLALNVVCYGHWTLTSLAVLVFYLYFSVWRQLQAGIVSVQSRHAAYSSLSQLPYVSKETLQQRRDACAICLSGLVEDVRITPCKHSFHSACLRKWLCVKQVCPLCYFDLSKCKISGAPEELFLEESGSINTPEDAESSSTESSDAENSSEDDEYFPWFSVHQLNGSDMYY